MRSAKRAAFSEVTFTTHEAGGVTFDAIHCPGHQVDQFRRGVTVLAAGAQGDGHAEDLLQQAGEAMQVRGAPDHTDAPLGRQQVALAQAVGDVPEKVQEQLPGRVRGRPEQAITFLDIAPCSSSAKR